MSFSLLNGFGVERFRSEPGAYSGKYGYRGLSEEFPEEGGDRYAYRNIRKTVLDGHINLLSQAINGSGGDRLEAVRIILYGFRDRMACMIGCNCEIDYFSKPPETAGRKAIGAKAREALCQPGR